ncbi:MAG: hypothetical protein IMW91_01530 [Firmicutes bacterium]|nr:hypothetical protein [Bacillota bacterium]
MRALRWGGSAVLLLTLWLAGQLPVYAASETAVRNAGVATAVPRVPPPTPLVPPAATTPQSEPPSSLSQQQSVQAQQVSGEQQGGRQWIGWIVNAFIFLLFMLPALLAILRRRRPPS